MWETVIGHDWATEVLASSIEHGRVGHAYLITGPEHVGKTTLARLFAMALSCSSTDSRPCGVCRACQLIKADRHPDIQLVLPEYNARGIATLKIDVIRELQNRLQLGCYEARYKIAILKQFDAATIGAANAFLKTLEEPPAHVILILTATDADGLLDTIKSRCRVISIRPIPTPLIKESLQTRWHLPSDEATLLAHLANGRLGWAVKASQESALLTTRIHQLELLETIVTETRIGRFKLADKLTQHPEQLPAYLHNWLTWWRDLILLAHEDSEETITNIDKLPQLRQHRQSWDKELILRCLKQTQTALWQLERNANAKLVIENLFLCYPKGASQPK